jgi:DNA-binding FrmR family transcriptional regulator
MIPEQRILFLARLRSAEGHLGSVIDMVETEQNCLKVLYQLHAVQAALQASGRYLLQCQVKQSIEIVSKDPCLVKHCTEINRLVDLYRFYQEFY